MKKLLSLLIVTTMMISMLASCGLFTPQSGNNNTGVMKDYTVTVSTAGGMAMPSVKLQVYELVDGQLGNAVEGASDITDADGEFSVKLMNDKSYAVRILSGVPKGYAGADDIYPINEGKTEIKLTSSVLPETDLTTVTYALGDVMHDFTVTTIDGEVFTLSEVLKTKKAVILNFWFINCLWCMVEFPLIDHLYAEYSDDIAIIALNPNPYDTVEMIEGFLENLGGLSFDFAQVPESYDTTFALDGYPTSILIDRYGVITLIEPYSLATLTDIENVVKYYTAEDYEQKLISDVTALTPEVQDEAVVIPEGATEIADYAYACNLSVETLVIPEGVTRIGKGAFQYCENLKTVVLPESLEVIDDSAFLYCYMLEEINIPGGVTKIGNNAFMMCQSIKSLDLPEGLTKVGMFSFLYCTSLTKLEIPGSIKSIGDGAFGYCQNVTEIVISAGVEELRSQAFFGCTSLESIIIPTSVKNIGEAVFYETNNLKDIYYMGTEEEWQQIVISGYNDAIANANIHYNYAG